MTKALQKTAAREVRAALALDWRARYPKKLEAVTGRRVYAKV